MRYDRWLLLGMVGSVLAGVWDDLSDCIEVCGIPFSAVGSSLDAWGIPYFSHCRDCGAIAFWSRAPDILLGNGPDVHSLIGPVCDTHGRYPPSDAPDSNWAYADHSRRRGSRNHRVVFGATRPGIGNGPHRCGVQPRTHGRVVWVRGRYARGLVAPVLRRRAYHRACPRRPLVIVESVGYMAFDRVHRARADHSASLGRRETRRMDDAD